MYTITIIRVVNGMFRGCITHKHTSKQGVLTEMLTLPAKESEHFVNSWISGLKKGVCSGNTLNGDGGQQWHCYISKTN